MWALLQQKGLRCYTQGFYIFRLNILLKSIGVRLFPAFGRIIVLLIVFSFSIFNQKRIDL